MLITLHTPTGSLPQSIDFYTKLGFQRICEDPPVYTDGKALIEINADRYARAGIKLYDIDPDRIHKMQAQAHLVPTPEGFLCSDPSGVWIYVTHKKPPFRFALQESAFSVLGNFAGLSLETTDLDKSCLFYASLGFQKSGGSAEGGYVTYMLDGFIVNLMRPLSCPHLFFNPSMTYFNGGRNLAVIEKIRALRIPITEEITWFNQDGVADNIIIRDPGGYGFFVFND